MNYKEEIEKLGYTTQIERNEANRNGRTFYRFAITLEHEDGSHHFAQRETSFYPSENEIYWCGYTQLRNALAIVSEHIQPQDTEVN